MTHRHVFEMYEKRTNSAVAIAGPVRKPRASGMKMFSSIRVRMGIPAGPKCWMLCVLLLGYQSSHGQSARFNLTDVNVSQVAAVLQDFTGKPVVLASDVTGSITLTSGKPLDGREAIALFATALREQGLTLRFAAGEIMVIRTTSSRTDRERDGAIETRVFTLQHLGVAEVSPAVRALLSRQGEISAKNNNTLIVSDKYRELVGITQYLMTADRAKERSTVQLECTRALNAASLLQQYFAAKPTKTVPDMASNEQWDQQLHVLIQTLENGAGCANDAAYPAAISEKRSLAGSTTKVQNQAIRGNAREGPPEGVFVPETKAAIEQATPSRDLETSPDEAKSRLLWSALEDWRTAWSRREVNSYFESYAPGFLPTGTNNMNAWKEKRKAVLTRAAEVSIEIADLSLTFTDVTHATMVFTQIYRSKNYSDITTKELQWIHVEGRWLISRESVMKRRSNAGVKIKSLRP